jgi:hypothetical protein
MSPTKVKLSGRERDLTGFFKLHTIHTLMGGWVGGFEPTTVYKFWGSQTWAILLSQNPLGNKCQEFAGI